jgi:hypothetical protein
MNRQKLYHLYHHCYAYISISVLTSSRLESVTDDRKGNFLFRLSDDAEARPNPSPLCKIDRTDRDESHSKWSGGPETVSSWVNGFGMESRHSNHDMSIDVELCSAKYMKGASAMKTNRPGKQKEEISI